MCYRVMAAFVSPADSFLSRSGGAHVWRFRRVRGGFLQVSPTTKAFARGGRCAPPSREGLSHDIPSEFATLVLAGSVLGGGFVALDAGNAGATQLPTVAVAATIDSVSTSAAAALATMGTPVFAVRFENTAYAVAATLGVDGGQMHQAWLRADQLHQVALLSALTQVGVPYHRNSSKVGVGFDCSGLTAFAWGQSGVELARNSSSRNSATPRREPIDTAQAGDLVYYPGHVMMWLGVDNLIVHAVQRGTRRRGRPRHRPPCESQSSSATRSAEPATVS